jgi:hypothetical protein
MIDRSAPIASFTVVWNRNSDAASVAAALHYDVAAAAALLDESVLPKDATHLASRQDAKSTHASLPWKTRSSITHRRATGERAIPGARPPAGPTT